jgi:hypothetical protein
MSFKYASSMSWVEREVTLGHRNKNTSGRSQVEDSIHFDPQDSIHFDP